MTSSVRPFGEQLREWRQRRRFTQLDLALEADISARHLSFVETGRAQPSRTMVLHLAQRLEVPLRERNLLLVSAGYAPIFPERSLDDPGLEAARRAMDLVLTGHEPYPALAIDRHWHLIASNRAVPPLLQGLRAPLLAPPVNVLRLSLHPEGLASRIVNLSQWRSHLLDRLRRQIDATADPVLAELMDELKAYPVPRDRHRAPAQQEDYGGVVVPLQIATENGTLSLFSTTTVFGTPVDVTVSELALESFYPADAATGDMLRRSCP